MSNTIYIGIDPGQQGAIGVIDAEGKFLDVKDWPGDEVNAARLVIAIVKDIKIDDTLAAIEYVHSYSEQGVASVFKFGTNFGIWRGILAAYKVPFVLVTPQKWQKGLITKPDKQLGKAKGHCAAASRLFPTAPLYGPRGGSKDGRADALMIADWRRRWK